MSGYKHTPEIVYEYVEEVDPNLTCAICQSALVDPVTTTSCKHTFCRDCITRAISVNPQCPIDRSALTLQSLNDTEQLVKLMLDELKVRCAAEECGMIMQRGLLLGHFRTCQTAIITCDDPECGLSMARQRLSQHRAYECFQRKMECRKCGVLLKFRDQTAHLRPDCEDQSEVCELCNEPLGPSKHLHGWSCPLARVACTHSSRGCPTVIARRDLDTHLASCPFEAMSSFFTMNDARFRALEERNHALESEVGRLRAELRDVRGNVSVARMSLGSLWRRDVDGPWARTLQVPRPTRVDHAPVEPNERNTATRVDHAPPEPIERNTAHTLDSPANTPSTLSSADSQPSSLNNESSLFDGPPSLFTSSITPRAASDFSALLESRHFPSSTSSLQLPSSTSSLQLPSSTSSLQLPPSSMSSSSTQSHADYAFSRLSLSTSPAAATQGLDEILSGLRAVVVNLAAGLDTMERRNEVRTMTESLRVLEEVGSLRAIVSTMRMQVMMDRPSSSANLRPPSLIRSPFSPNAPMPNESPFSDPPPAPSPMRATPSTTSTSTPTNTNVSPTPTPTNTNANTPTKITTNDVPTNSTTNIPTASNTNIPTTTTMNVPTTTRNTPITRTNPTPTPIEEEEEERNEHRTTSTPSVRESIVFSDLHSEGRLGPSSSTSSLVSTGVPARARARGRPMGLPAAGQWELATATVNGEPIRRQSGTSTRKERNPITLLSKMSRPSFGGRL